LGMIKFFEALATLFFLTYLISMWVSFGFLPAIVGVLVYIIVAFVIKKISYFIKKPTPQGIDNTKIYHTVNDLRGELYKERMDNKITQVEYNSAEKALNKLWSKFK